MRLPALLIGLAALAPFAGCGGDPAPEAPARPPDVLLLIVDTLRADHLSTYGYPIRTSPSIDALASQGVVFERAVSGASSTAPSHASVFSSQFTRGHSVGMANGSTRLEGVTTLAQSFREAGYATAAFVGNAMLDRRLGFDQGFEVYDDDLPTREGARGLFERRADETTERALTWLAQQGEKPFFLWVHYQDPHGPYTPPEALEGELRGELRVAPRRGEQPLPLGARGPGAVPRYQAVDGVTLPSQYQTRYGGEILYADAAIGRLLAAVEAHHPDRETVVLLTADHGEAMGEAGYWFEHGVATTPDQAHVPFVLRAPGIAPDRRREIVHHVDVYPTLLELAGIAPPDGLRGLALGPYLRDERALPDRVVFSDDGRELSAYRGDRFVRVVLDPATPARRRRRAEPELTAHAWREDGSWEPTSVDLEPWRAEIGLYLLSRAQQRPAAPPSPELSRQLRALGYVVEPDE